MKVTLRAEAYKASTSTHTDGGFDFDTHGWSDVPVDGVAGGREPEQRRVLCLGESMVPGDARLK